MSPWYNHLFLISLARLYEQWLSESIVGSCGDAIRTKSVWYQSFYWSFYPSLSKFLVVVVAYPVAYFPSTVGRPSWCRSQLSDRMWSKYSGPLSLFSDRMWSAYSGPVAYLPTACGQDTESVTYFPSPCGRQTLALWLISWPHVVNVLWPCSLFSDRCGQHTGTKPSSSLFTLAYPPFIIYVRVTSGLLE